MARRNIKTYTFEDMTGGLDLDSSPFDVPKGCIINCSNVLPSTVVGGIVQRNGYTKHNSVAIQNHVQGIFSFNWGGTEYFVAQAGTKFYNNSPDGTWSDITGSLTLTDSLNNLTSFDSMFGNVFMANRNLDQMWSWSLSGNATAIANPPSGGGTILCSWGDRMWAGGNNTNPILVYFSALTDGTDYSGTTDGITGLNFLNCDDGQGDLVTGIARAPFNTMLIFKNKSIIAVEPYSGASVPFTKYCFVDGVGCVSQQSIVYIPGGGLMWWDTNDIYMLFGNQVMSATDHPKTKKPRLRNFFRNLINRNRLQYVCGAYYPALDIVRWHFASTSSNTNDSYIDYHLKTRSWWLGTIPGTTCCRRTVNGVDFFYSADASGFVYKHDTGYNDNGSAINWNFQIPWQDFEGIDIRKKADMIYSILSYQGNYDVLCDIFTNQNLNAVISDGVLSQGTVTGAVFDTAVWDTDVFGQEGATLVEASLSINYLFKSISASIHGSNSDVPVNILRLLMTERPLEITRGLS